MPSSHLLYHWICHLYLLWLIVFWCQLSPGQILNIHENRCVNSTPNRALKQMWIRLRLCCWWDRIHSGHVSWTLPGHLRYFHRFSDAFLIDIWWSQHSLVYLWLLNIRAILHVDRTATATYYQSHRSMLHLFHPSYLQPIISLEIEVFSLISHGHWSIIVMHY